MSGSVVGDLRALAMVSEPDAHATLNDAADKVAALVEALKALIEAADFEPDGMLRLHDRGLNWESEKLTKAREALRAAGVDT